MLTLSLLGPLSLRRDGVALGLPIKKTQALLVWLALESSASRAVLCDALWPSLDESAARRNLRRELARVREAGAAGLLVADGDRLALDAAVALDLQAVERAFASGQAQAALAAYGGPLADGLHLEDAPAFNARLAVARQRWHGRWRQAHEACAGAARAGGDLGRAIGHLQILLDDEPLQEQHHQDLIALLAQAGRRENALAQFERCRELLSRELGLQPLAATLALAASLRVAGATVEPALPAAAQTGPSGATVDDVAAARPRLVLPDPLPFVGRKREVDLLERAWRAGGSLLLQGEGGVGKTRLALDFAQAHGSVALVRCRAGDRGVPYAVFVRALRAMAGEALEQVSWPTWMRAELVRLLPALGPAPRDLSSAEQRARFHEACAEAWQLLAAGNFDAVLIDDAHLADAPSHGLLGYIAQRRHDCAAPAAATREILTWRERELDDTARVALTAMAALPHACRIDLHPLSADELLDLVRHLSGAQQPQRFTAMLMQATRGHPFFVAETLRHLVDSGRVHGDAQGRWQTDHDDATQDYRELDVPASVHEGVMARVRALDGPGQRVLEAASLSGEPFDPALLGAACALSELQTAAALEQALQAQLVRELRPGQWGFAHDLVQQAIGERLGQERRRLVHRRLALGAEQSGAEPAVVARHFEAGAEPTRAVAWRIRAAERALALGALPDAHAHWQAVLDAGPTPGVQVTVHSGQFLAGQAGGDEAVCVAAVQALQRLVEGGSLGADDAAQARLVLAQDAARRGPHELALDRTAVLLAVLPNGHPLRAPALLTRCECLSGHGRLAEGEAAAQAGLAAGPTPDVRARLMDALVLVGFRRGDPKQALAWARQALDLAEASADHRNVALSHGRVGVLLYMLGQREAGEQQMQRGLAMTREHRLIENQREITFNLAKMLMDRGDTDTSLRLAQEAWSLSPGFTQPEIRMRLVDTFYTVHVGRGDLGAALDVARRIVDEAIAHGAVRPLLMAVNTTIDLHVLLDDLDGVARLLALVDALPLAELGYVRIKLCLKRAAAAAHQGDAAGARNALGEVGDPAALQAEQDLAALALAQAEIAHLEGRPEEVVQSLTPWCLRWPHLGLASRGLTLLLGAGDPATHAAEARAVLGDAGLGPLLALGLRAALMPQDPALQALQQSEVQRLLASLAGYPLLAAAFKQRWQAR
jgi:DNA-binding SARP family transcriptional activator/tetratricopeptide (TPR) repeat protein